jgi:hypothetical protein
MNPDFVIFGGFLTSCTHQSILSAILASWISQSGRFSEQMRRRAAEKADF